MKHEYVAPQLTQYGSVVQLTGSIPQKEFYAEDGAEWCQTSVGWPSGTVCAPCAKP